jgi:hypothetical protein
VAKNERQKRTLGVSGES